MMNEAIQHRYQSLTDSLRLLAMPYEQQKACFPDVVIENALASSFHDAIVMSLVLIEEGILSKETTASLVQCKIFLDQAIRNKEKLDGSSDQNLWGRVKICAIETLELMGEQVEAPDLS